MRFDEGRFRAFFELLPRDTLAAARLARDHDPWMKGRTAPETDANRPLRHAVEFRHESFLSDRFIALLREHHVALVAADAAGKFPTSEDVTADWVYVRLHGSRRLYVSGYTPREIEAWARKIEAWRDGVEPAEARRIGAPAPAVPGGRDVYVFFDNTDVKLRAPVDARRMAERLGIGPGESPGQILKSLGVRQRTATAKDRSPAGRAAKPRGKRSAAPAATSPAAGARWPSRRPRAARPPPREPARAR
jgi:uncharacterized protein YecE (DUF72 family)